MEIIHLDQTILAEDIVMALFFFKEARGEFHRKSFFFEICSYTYNGIVYTYVKF